MAENNNSNGNSSQNNGTEKNIVKKDYNFGGVKAYDLEKIEQEVLKESVYLDVFAGSDPAFKTECQKLSAKDIGEKLNALQAYSFKYKTENYPSNNFPEGTQFGFMADQVESIFPNLVKKDSEGHGFVNYTQVVPLMVETIKDLTARIEALEAKIEKK